MEPEGSALPCSVDLATGTHPEGD